MVNNYRTGYNLFACNGILFNHESPRRGETFATRKITRGLANIVAKKGKKSSRKKDLNGLKLHISNNKSLLNIHYKLPNIQILRNTI